MTKNEPESRKCFFRSSMRFYSLQERTAVQFSSTWLAASNLQCAASGSCFLHHLTHQSPHVSRKYLCLIFVGLPSASFFGSCPTNIIFDEIWFDRRALLVFFSTRVSKQSSRAPAGGDVGDNVGHDVGDDVSDVGDDTRVESL